MRIVVPISLDILAIPIDFSTGPVNRSLGVGGESSGPDGDLHTGWGLWVLPLVGRCVPGILALLCASDLAVDGPDDFIGRPFDGVVVVVVEGIGEGDVTALVVWSGISMAQN